MDVTNEPSGKKSNFIQDLIDEDLKSSRFNTHVQTRFPPEPNGFLHAGHAKAICLNFGIARDYSGLFNLRFDDTNPVTENSEYVFSIRKDLEWLLGEELESDPLHTSDYFEQLYLWAELLIKNGKAYVDDQDAETISIQRGSFQEVGVNIFVVKNSIDTQTQQGKMFSYFISIFSEMERDMIVSRQSESIKRLREKDTKWGKGKLMNEETKSNIFKLRDEGLSYRKICEELSVSKGSVQHALRSHG